MGGAYIGGGIRHAQIIRWEILKRRDNLVQLGVDWRILLNCILKAGLKGMYWIQPTHGRVTRLTHLNKVQSKAFPLQAWTGPEGSRRLRLLDCKTIGT
jgi:hypothetical protein